MVAVPLLSFVVIAYNVQPYIIQCLQSVKAQTLDDFEVIVVDDASTDGTLECITREVADDQRFHIIAKSENEGAHNPDGTVSDIPRAGYAKTEKRVIEELDALGKPYVILLNSTRPDAPETKQLAEGMARDYHHAVLPVSCVDLDAAALGDILRQVLYEFPVRELDLALPRWVNRLENGHWLQAHAV